MNRLIITIPHSGERIPDEAPWLRSLPEPILMCDVDRYVDRLYEPTLKALAIPHVIAQWHRYAVDLNRLEDDVDASTVQGHQNPAGTFSRGLHWKITTYEDILMPYPMLPATHAELVLKYFHPFHADVRRMVQTEREAGAQTIYHLDLHSMPSLGTHQHRDPGHVRADVVVSDNKGKSASAGFKDLVIRAYQDQGFTVDYNWPYFGGRITEMYGHPSHDHHAIQVELNRALYMDESSKKTKPTLWPDLQQRLNGAVTEVSRSLAAFS